MIPADEIKRELLNRYSVDPKGWRVLVGRDPKGYDDLIVIHGPDLWQIKEFKLNPYESTGLGVKREVEREFLKKINSPYTFGLRPLNTRQIRDVVTALEREEDTSRLVRQVMQTDPVPPNIATGSIIAQGPVMHYPNLTSLISEGQREVDLQLRSELDSLVGRKHPHLFRQYI
jgi:hypothetical protein